MSLALRSAAFTLVLVHWLPNDSEGHNGTVGLFEDLATRLCVAEVDSGEAVRVFIAVELEGNSADGITGASFSIRGLPPSWQAVAIPDPASSVAIGNPFSGSASIAFPSCQLGDAGLVKLYDVLLIATSQEVNLELKVCAAEPSPFDLQGPFIAGCDLDEWLSGSGRKFGINAPSQYECSVLPSCGPVAIQQRSWGDVKLPYRR